MAKCALCNSRKGKRECRMVNAPICSLCCGQSRKYETCEGCSHYRDVQSNRRYSGIPKFSTAEMNADMELQSYANTIEATLCLWDQTSPTRLRDDTALRVLELLLDRYHFRDENVSVTEAVLFKGLEKVTNSINQDLADVPEEVIAKVIGVVYFVAKRRSKGGREYLDFIHQLVGVRVGSGVRVLPAT